MPITTLIMTQLQLPTGALGITTIEIDGQYRKQMSIKNVAALSTLAYQSKPLRPPKKILEFEI
jgi:hypothetical protein